MRLPPLVLALICATGTITVMTYLSMPGLKDLDGEDNIVDDLTQASKSHMILNEEKQESSPTTNDMTDLEIWNSEEKVGTNMPLILMAHNDCTEAYKGKERGSPNLGDGQAAG